MPSCSACKNLEFAKEQAGRQCSHKLPPWFDGGGNQQRQQGDLEELSE